MREEKFSKKLPKESTSFRLAPQEKRKLEKEAEEYNLTLSDYMARLVIDIRKNWEQDKESLKIANEKNISLQKENEFYKSMAEKYEQEKLTLKKEIEDLKANSIDLKNAHGVTKDAIEKLQEKYPNHTKQQIVETCIIEPIEYDQYFINAIYDKNQAILNKYFQG